MKTTHIAFALCATFAAQSAGAASFDVSQQNADIFDAPRYVQGVEVVYKNDTQNLAAGIFRLVAKQLINGVPQDAQNFDAFCIDLDNDIDLPKVYMTAPNYFAAQTAGRIDALFSNIDVASIGDSRTAAATQLALWEIITDDALDFDAGDFQLTSNNPTGTVSDAGVFLQNILDGENNVQGGWTGAGANFLFLDATGSQDLIAFGVQPIPLPASAWLLVAGIAGLGALRRKRA